MSAFLPLTLALALPFLAPASPLPATATATTAADLDRFQGVWTACAGPKRGIAVTMEVRGEDVAVTVKPPVGAPIKAKGRLRVDPSASPKALDWVRLTADDGQAFPEILGIYEFLGDSFRVCTGGLSNARPTEFEPGDGVLCDVVTFRRPPAR